MRWRPHPFTTALSPWAHGYKHGHPAHRLGDPRASRRSRRALDEPVLIHRLREPAVPMPADPPTTPAVLLAAHYAGVVLDCSRRRALILAAGESPRRRTTSSRPQGDRSSLHVVGTLSCRRTPTLRSMPLTKRGAVNDAARIDRLAARGGQARTGRQGRLWSVLTVRYQNLQSGIALGRCPLVVGTWSSVAFTASSVDTWPPPLPPCPLTSNFF